MLDLSNQEFLSADEVEAKLHLNFYSNSRSNGFRQVYTHPNIQSD
jgi:hypothetical protein